MLLATPMTILLVEDDDVIAEFVSGGLREAGYAVERVRDGEEGLRLAAEEPEPVSKALSTYLNRAIDELPEREREILNLRFGLRNGRECALRELSARFGISAERVRQIQARAIRRLQETLPDSRDSLLQQIGD